jgi:hypothetical protein
MLRNRILFYTKQFLTTNESIMKKFLVLNTLAMLLFISCQKEVAINSPGRASVSNLSSSSGDIVVKDDLTGFQLENLCTGEIMTAISGDAVLNFSADGNLRSLTIHNFVFQTADGTIYRNNYIFTFELTGSTGLINTYRMISNPQGTGTHWVMQGEFKVIWDINGNNTVQFDKFFLKCL